MTQQPHADPTDPAEIRAELGHIHLEIELILNQWQQGSEFDFIEQTRRGHIPEAVHDAIGMTNLLDARERLEKQLQEAGYAIGNYGHMLRSLPDNYCSMSILWNSVPSITCISQGLL